MNRYWAHFFGRGIVEPPDDMRLTNPPSNPELLDGLADQFVKSGYDLQGPGPGDLHQPGLRAFELARTRSNAKDRQSFARHYPRRMGAEVLLDAIAQVSGVATAVRRPAGGHPRDRSARRERRLDVPRRLRPAQARDLVRMRARDRRQLEPEPDAAQLERGADQALVTGQPGRAARQGSAARCSRRSTSCSGRPSRARATEQETASAMAHLARTRRQPPDAYEDIIWALINAKEFQFID